MTKLLFCGACFDLVSPDPVNMQPRWCRCKRHAVWWRDGAKGLISVNDKMFFNRNGGDGGVGWIIGIHNGLLTEGGVTAHGYRAADKINDPPQYAEIKGNLVTTKETVDALLDDTPDSYIFKRAMSLIIRISPGESSDSQWDQLPTEAEMAAHRPACSKCNMKKEEAMFVAFCQHKECPHRK